MLHGHSDHWQRLYALLPLSLTDGVNTLGLLRPLYDAFVAKGDATGALLSAATAVTTYHAEWSSFAGIQSWIKRLTEHNAAEGETTLVSLQTRINCAMLVAPHLADHAFEDRLTRQHRLEQLRKAIVENSAEFEVNELFLAARCLFELIEFDNWLDAFEAVTLVVEAHSRDSKLDPRLLGRTLVFQGRCYLRFNLQHRIKRYADRAERCWQQVDAIAQSISSKPLAFAAAQSRLFAATTRGELDRFASLVDAMECNADIERPMQLAEYFVERTKLALAEGQSDIALSSSTEALSAYARADVTQQQRGPAVVAHILALALSGRYRDAATEAERHLKLQTGRPRDVFSCLSALLHALHHAEAPNGTEDELRKALAQGMTIAVNLRWPNFFASLPKLASRVCALALLGNIERDFVRSVVVQRKLPPPAEPVAGWPWPVQIDLLGTFDLQRYGQHIELGGRVQKKPLELLKCLAAAGPDGVDADALATALWPDADGAQSRSSLKVTTLRVRKLLESDEAVELRDGRIALAPTLCHTDVAQFLRVTNEIERALDARRRGDGGDDRARMSSELLAAYGGTLLGEEPVNPWLARLRERLHHRFLRICSELARALHAEGHADAACSLLERATERDPIAEHLHRQLMELHIQQGEQAEAMRVFRRLRQSLSVVLGIQPSDRTVALVKDLRGG